MARENLSCVFEEREVARSEGSIPQVGRGDDELTLGNKA